MKKFKAILENPERKQDVAYISIPFDVEKEFGSKGMVKVKATFDGHPYRGVISNMGTGCHILIARKDVRQAIGKKVGDTVQITLEKDLDERVVELPEDLQRTLSKNKKAHAFFDTLSYTNRKEYAVWIASAKREETRTRRLNEIIPRLLAGRKNPSEK
ncbi:MAG: DUF1905 domain-containing protein [Cyclobacteriaceae bacterium]|nr:DUF1905 domain-containing protein [Cyclobacteriaceae bacterium]